MRSTNKMKGSIGMETNIYDENKRKELADKITSLTTELEALKKNRFNPFTLGLWGFPVIALGGFTLMLMIGNGSETPFAIFAVFIMLLFPFLLIGRSVFNAKKATKIKRLEYDITNTNANGYSLVGDWLCSMFGITSVMLTAELELLSTSYQNIVCKSTKTTTTVVDGIRHTETITTYDFWQNTDCINGVKDLLGRKFKSINFTDSEQDLKLQNLKLQNESIAIDNTQKKFWTCQFCGNMNRADDMSCIKCGGIRPSMD